MQKKVIALAVAGLVSGAALAQSNVTVYGVADVSDVYATDNSKESVKSTNAIQSGSAGLNGSRFGFKGVEDLGNGLSVKFRMEGGLNMDDGTSAQGGQLMGRWSTVGLASKTWGEIEAGRRESFQYQLLAGAAGNGRGTVAANSAVYVAQDRYNNFVAYTSPSWNGLVVKAGYASNGTDSSGELQDVVPNEITATNAATKSNLRVYTAAVAYTNGALTLGAAADYNHYQDLNSSLAGDKNSGSYKGGNVWNIAAVYDFGVVRVDAALGAINYANNAQFSETKDNRKQWTVGAVVPIGSRDRVMLSYAHANVSYLDSAKHDDAQALWGLNYMHDLSKRTVIYAAYATIDQNNGNTSKVSLAGTGSSSGYQQAIQLGLRHNF